MKYAKSIVLLNLFLLLCGCGKDSPVTEPTESTPVVEESIQSIVVEEPTVASAEVIYTMEDLNLVFAQTATVKGHTLSFSMTNQSQSALCWGYDLTLEMLSNSQWVQIDRLAEIDGVYLEIPPVEYVLLPGDTELISIDLKHYGVETLENGTYRVLIPMSIEGIKTTGLLEIPIVIEA